MKLNPNRECKHRIIILILVTLKNLKEINSHVSAITVMIIQIEEMMI